VQEDKKERVFLYSVSGNTFQFVGKCNKFCSFFGKNISCAIVENDIFTIVTMKTQTVKTKNNITEYKLW
jgi:hypothetical protein